MSSLLLSRRRAEGAPSRRRANNRPRKDHTSPFLDDPVRGPVLHISNDITASLQNNDHISTALVDFLLQNVFPEKDMIQKEILIGSSNAMEFLKVMTDTKKYPVSSAEIMAPIQQNHRQYGSGRYRLLAPICMGDFRHFHVVDVVFDIASDEVFEHVIVYDSCQATPHTPVGRLSPPGQFLCRLQTFLIRFCFSDKQETVS